MIFLDNSTSTAQSDFHVLPAGKWEFTLDTANASASVTIQKRRDGSTTDLPVTESGTAVALTTTAPCKIVISSGDKYAVTNAEGSSAATVVAKRIPD